MKKIKKKAKDYAIDPELRKRRLLTLIDFLELGECKSVSRNRLTLRERRDWATQCRNIL